MSRKSAISLVPRAPKAKLTAEQERFRYLIAQIQTARTAHATWERTAGKFRAEHTQRLQPLRASLRELSRGTVVEIDRLLGESGWSRVDRVALRQILWVTADALLAANPDDLELRELFEKHSERDFDAVKQEEMQRLREEAEELTGLDLGDDDDIRTEEELVQRMYERMAEREAAEEERESARARERRHTAEEKRKEAAAQLVRQSLREIYRKLASAVHPDREADAKKREEKNALMQRINQAYAANDLMALSRERIADELLKLLALADPSATVAMMIERGILAPVLPEIQGARSTWFCGAWTRYGFHEDGFASALEVARAFEVEPLRQAA